MGRTINYSSWLTLNPLVFHYLPLLTTFLSALTALSFCFLLLVDLSSTADLRNDKLGTSKLKSTVNKAMIERNEGNVQEDILHRQKANTSLFLFSPTALYFVSSIVHCQSGMLIILEPTAYIILFYILAPLVKMSK